MKKAKSTWKPFTAILSGTTSYEFNCDSYVPIDAGDVEVVTKRWGDILDIQEMTSDQIVEQAGVVEASNPEPTAEVPTVPEL